MSNYTWERVQISLTSWEEIASRVNLFLFNSEFIRSLWFITLNYMQVSIFSVEIKHGILSAIRTHTGGETFVLPLWTVSREHKHPLLCFIFVSVETNCQPKHWNDNQIQHLKRWIQPITEHTTISFPTLPLPSHTCTHYRNAQIRRRGSHSAHFSFQMVSLTLGSAAFCHNRPLCFILAPFSFSF